MIRPVQAWLLLLLMVICVLVYSPALSTFFVLDDIATIFESPYSKDPTILLNNPWLSALSERLVTRIFFWSGVNLWSGDAKGLHIAGLILHLLNGFLIWLVTITVLRLSRAPNSFWASFAAATLFLLHPLQTQAVNYISQSSAQLEVFFNLLSLLLYLRLRTRRISGMRLIAETFLLTTLVLAAFASKPNGLTIIGQFFLLEIFIIVPTQKKTMHTWAVVWGLALSAIVISGLLMPAGVIDTPRISRLDYILSQPYVVAQYLRLTILPIGLSFDHPSIHWAEYGSWTLALWTCVHLSTLLIAFILKRSQPLIAFGIVFVYATLSAESTLIPLRDFMVEHRMYLPMVGVSIAASSVISTCRQQRIIWTSISVLAVVFSSLSLFRNLDWKTEDRLWKATLVSTPTSARALLYFGNQALNRADIESAKHYFYCALNHHPLDASVMNSLAVTLIRSNEMESAMKHLLRALELQPYDYETYLNIGYWFEVSGDVNQAEDYYLKAIRRCPQCAEPRLHLGTLLLKNDQPARAKRQLTEATKSAFCPARAFYNLGYLQLIQRDSSNALINFELAFEKDPEFEDALAYAADLTFALEGRTSATPYYMKLLKIDPKNNLAKEFLEAGNGQ